MKDTQFFDRDLTYREALLEAALTFKYLIGNLEDRIFDIALTSELNDWVNTLPEDEIHQIGMDVFEACEDKNVCGFVEVLKMAKRVNACFKNYNSIQNTEIKKYEDDKFDSYWYDDSDDPFNKV